jgi:hypothetical protein
LTEAAGKQLGGCGGTGGVGDGIDKWTVSDRQRRTAFVFGEVSVSLPGKRKQNLRLQGSHLKLVDKDAVVAGPQIAPDGAGRARRSADPENRGCRGFGLW